MVPWVLEDLEHRHVPTGEGILHIHSAYWLMVPYRSSRLSWQARGTCVSCCSLSVKRENLIHVIDM